MLQSLSVNIKPSIGSSQFTWSHEFRSALWWWEMQKVEVHSTQISTVQVFECCYAIVFVNLDELGFPVPLNAFGLDNWFKRIRKLGVVREHVDRSWVPLNASLVTYSILAESLLWQVHHLLGRTATLDRHSRQGKKSITTFEFFSHQRRFVGTFEVVNRRSGCLIALKSFFRSLDQVPSELGAGSNDQVLVSNFSTIVERDLILIRLEWGHTFLAPVDSRLLSEEFLLWSHNKLVFNAFSVLSWAINATTNHRVSGLVMMLKLWVEDCHITVVDFIVFHQLSWNGVATGASTDNSNSGLHWWERSLKQVW